MPGPYTSPWTAVLAVGGGGAVVSVVVSPITDRLTLTPATPTVTVLVDGVPAVPDSHLWEAVGPAGVTGGGTATPTITPVANGMVGVSCAVVVDGETYHSAVVEFRVGDADGKIQVHHADWTDAGSAVDFGGGALTKTIDGLTYDRYMAGTVFSFAATAGVGLSIDPNSADAGVRIAGNALSVGMETDAVYYVALAANTLNGDGDQVSVVIACASGDWATAYAVRSGGVQRVGTYTSAGQRDEPTAGGGQIRQMALRVRGYQVEIYYSETAFSGSFLALSEMTKASSAPAGFFTMSTLMHGGASVDRRVPASDTVWWIVPIASTGPVTITHTEVRRSQPGGGASDGPPLTVTASSPALPFQRTLAAVGNLQTAAGINVAGGTGPFTCTWSSAAGGTFGNTAAINSSWTPTSGGVYTLVLQVVDVLGATATVAVVVTVGKYVVSLGKWVTLRVAIDYTADATTSWLAAGATPTARTLGGYGHTSRNANRATAFGAVNGSGIQMQNDANLSNRLTGPMLYIRLQELLPGWTYGDAFVIQSELETPTFADGSAYLGLCLCSEEPTTTSGEYVVVAGYEKVATATYKAFVDHTVSNVNVSSGTTTLSGEISVQELVYDGTGVEYGVIYADPAGTPPDPGSGTRIPVVAAAPTDTGPIAWVTRRPGTAAENPANAYLAFVTHGNNANCIRYLERLWVWA